MADEFLPPPDSPPPDARRGSEPPPPPSEEPDVPPPPPSQGPPEEIPTDSEEDFADENEPDSGEESPQSQLHARRLQKFSIVEDDLFSSDDEEIKQRMSVAVDAQVRQRDDAVVRSAFSDADIQGKPVTLTEDRVFQVTKANRFRRMQPRNMVVDVQHRALRFLGDNGKMRSEFPFTEIVEIKRSGSSLKSWDQRNVMIVFRGARAYQIKFKTLTDCEEFVKMAKIILAQNVFCNLRSRTAPGSSLKRSIINESTIDMSTLASISLEDNEKGDTLQINPHAASLDDQSPPDSPTGNEDESMSRLDSSIVTDPLIETDYLDYHVKKKNKYGRKQDRILVVNTRKRSLLLLDDRRKFKKEFPLDLITQVEVPKSRKGKGRAYIVFDPSLNQKPFNVYFTDEFDRINFCERIQSLSGNITVKDQDDDVSNSHCLRFTVLKVNRMGVRMKRILYLDCMKQSIRSLNVKAAVKDTDIGGERITSVVKSLLDRRALTICFKDRGDWNFVLSDAAARERMAVRVRAIANGIYQAKQFKDPFDEKNPHRPDLKLSIFTGTWNMGSSEPPKQADPRLTAFIPPAKHDIYVIGFQECPKRDQWAETIKTHINDDWNRNKKEKDLMYEVVANKGLWEIGLIVFVHKNHLHRISNIEAGSVPTGIGGIGGNKGGVAVSMYVEDTSLCFICSHLAARAERLRQRKENYQKIVRNLDLGIPEFDILSQFEHVIWLGDLNYRIEIPFQETIDHVKGKNWPVLHAADQLRSEMQASATFVGFQEGSIDFAPTYRMERDVHEYNNKRDQAPSYTDRVLWRSFPERTDLTLDRYTGVHDCLGSDHRPVVAEFTLDVTPPYPLGIDPSFSSFPPCQFVLSELRFAVDKETELSRMQLRFQSKIMESEVETLDVPVKENTWYWQQRLVLTPFVFNKEFLATQHLIVTVTTPGIGDSDSIGHCVLSFKKALGPDGAGFKSVVMKDGCIVGVLTGEYCTEYQQRTSLIITPIAEDN